ncbi:tetraacyldisaccharide 4'-kinase [Malonomonas rubra]|uniref:tetraacyldisaccharide 4'-kinase n=1 Tax=Malonomonas rubra TaxID=57040 RepID=UPI0026EE3CBA|nr:tetraacyldisaccharide 4'-kinase [Malonomonas rubra]
MNRLLQYHRRLAVAGPNDLLDSSLFLLLLPFSLLYGVAGLVRGWCYDIGVFSSYRAPVPVVSVGNLAAGGTGKTPVVDWLIKEFIQQGKKPAVVSRGYGGSFVGSVGVVSEGYGLLLDATEAGDEPCLLAQRNPGAVVLIARKRADGVRFAIEKYAADVVILDDGFQHRAVRRDLDLVLLDAKRPVANGCPLPAGLLREFPAALKRADLLLLTRAERQSDFDFGRPVYCSRHQLADTAVALTGETIKFTQLKNMRLCAFAGIANPEGFFAGLRASGLTVERQLSLGDHCQFDSQMLQQIRAASSGCDALITTEKDAVKLRGDFFDLPCYQAPMDILIENESAFRTEVQRRLWSK